mgnify:CR=1 FL=1
MQLLIFLLYLVVISPSNSSRVLSGQDDPHTIYMYFVIIIAIGGKCFLNSTLKHISKELSFAITGGTKSTKANSNFLILLLLVEKGSLVYFTSSISVFSLAEMNYGM